MSAGERSNLLALQSTADLTSTVQQRLATGKRVNSALDNPQNYFTARSLDSRVGDLNNLLDGMRQAEQSLAEAGNGISALIKLVQSAKSIAAEAKQAPQPATGFYSSAFTVGTTALTAPAATVITGTTDMTAATADMYGMVINVGGVAYTVATTDQYKTGAQIVADINNTPGLGSGGAATASLDGSGHLVLSSNSAAAVSVDLNDGAMSTGLFNPDLLTANPALDGTTLNVQAQNSPAATVQFGTGAGQVHDLSGLYQAAHPAGVMPWLWSQKLGFYDAQMPWPNQGSLTISGSAVAPLGMTSGTYSYGPVGSSDPTRAALAQQYNAILDQIAALSGDSSYAGTNLLAGGDLRGRAERVRSRADHQGRGRQSRRARPHADAKWRLPDQCRRRCLCQPARHRAERASQPGRVIRQFARDAPGAAGFHEKHDLDAPERRRQSHLG